MEMFVRTSPLSPHTLSAVAIGGAVGATARWAVGTPWDVAPGTWPWATLVVNVLGCLAIGFAARRIYVDSTAWAFVVTGVLGGFTTFSAFAVELNAMVSADRTWLAVTYGAVTLVAGIGATLVARGGRANAEITR